MIDTNATGNAGVRTEAGVRLPLSPPTQAAGGQVAAAFRPEHVLVGPRGALEARVEVVETLGSRPIYVYVDGGANLA